MRIEQCLEVAVAGGEIDRAQAQELTDLFERYVRQYETALGPADARRRAQEEIAGRLEAEATQRKRAALLQLEKVERIDQFIFSFKNARGEIDPAAGLQAVISNRGEQYKGTSSIDGRMKAIIGTTHTDLQHLLAEFERKFITGATPAQGRNTKARLSDIVREIHGEDTGDPAAKAFADAWTRVSEQMRQRYNEQGGAIGKLEGGYIPQRHDGRAMRKAGYPAWRDFINERLDWDAMRHHLTGSPILPDEREEVLRYVFDTVTTEGWAHRDPSMAPKGRGSLVRQHAESRFLKFKDADAWTGYQKQFGEGNAFASMMGHINLMARDIATMEIMGPNPDATMEWARQAITREAQQAKMGDPARFPTKGEIWGRKFKEPDSYAKGAINLADRMYDIVRGSANIPVQTVHAENAALARNWTTATMLGSAVVSALPTDPIFGAFARRFAAGSSDSMPYVSDVLTTLGDTVTAMQGMKRHEAVRAGLILDSAQHVLEENTRYAASQAAVGSRIADRVITWQGLQGLTQSGRHGFGLHMMGAFADQITKDWSKLAPELRLSLERYGLDETDWSVMQVANRHDLSPHRTRGGAFILRPQEIQALGSDALKSFSDDRVRMAAGLMLDAIDAGTITKASSMKVILDIADTVAPAGPRLAELIRKIGISDLDEVRALISDLAADRRYEAGSLPTDAVADKVRRYVRALGERYLEVILQETDYAVPQATVRSRAALLGETKPGTGVGELTRFFTQFKSFGVAVWQLHAMRLLRERVRGNPGSARNAAAFAIFGTLGGAVALQLKSIKDGKDTQEMGHADFWMRAAVQGGGFGIWGDFLIADANRGGGSWASTMVGPFASKLENLWQLTGGNLQELAQGKKTNAGRELARFLELNTPFHSIWYMKLAWQRVLWDQLQETIDPDAGTAHRRRKAFARKQRTDYWWPPGETSPDRAPDLGRAFEVR